MDWTDSEPQEASPLQYGDTLGQDLLVEELDSPPSWLSNFIVPGSLTLVHAAPGTGKTPFTMQLCNAALGYNNLFNWRKDLSETAKSCYYMDGELPRWLLKRNYLANFNTQAPVTFFHMATMYKYQQGLDLGDQYWQDAMLKHLERNKPDILVLDNRSNFYHGPENDNDEAIKFNTFLVSLREMGMAILINHHQGKMGQSRGASAIQDIMDTVIRLDKLELDEGVKDQFWFDVKFEKARMGWQHGFKVTARIQTTGDIFMFND